MEVLDKCYPDAKLKRFPFEFLKDRDFLLKALALEPSTYPAIPSIPQKFREDHEVMTAAFTNGYIYGDMADASILSDPDVVHQLTIKNVGVLKFASSQLQDDFEFLCLCNFKRQPWGAKHISERIRNDHSLVKLLLRTVCDSHQEMTKYLRYFRFRRTVAMQISSELYEELGRPTNWAHPYMRRKKKWVTNIV